MKRRLKPREEQQGTEGSIRGSLKLLLKSKMLYGIFASFILSFCIACEHSHWAFSATLAFSFAG